MTKKRKNKNIILNQEASDFLRKRLNRRIIPYEPTIIDNRIFVTIAEGDIKTNTHSKNNKEND